MKIFAQLTKIDAEKRLVYGRAAQEVVDKSDEILDYAKSKPYFEAWSAAVSKDTDGKSLGNLRAMHGKVVAGKLVEMQYHDADKAIDIVTKIVDDNEWQKTLEGCYRGFSIGGSYVGDPVVEKIDDRDIKRYVADPNEISLVDSPCIPTAKFFEVRKLVDGKEQIEKVEFKAAEVNVSGTPEQVDEFAKAMSYGGFTMADALAWVNVQAMLDDVDAMTKREFSTDERKAAAKAGEALPDGSFPIKSVSDLHNAIQAYGRAKDKPKAKAHIIARAKALGASKELPEAWTKGEKAEGGELAKGMWNVSRFAECLQCLASICESAQIDADMEGDDSPVPMKLRNELADLIECFKEMSDEESSEMLAALKTSAGIGEDDEIEMALEMAFTNGKLVKRLEALPNKALAAEAFKVLGVDVVSDLIDKTPQGDLHKALREALTKKLGKSAKVDAAHLQEAHDHLSAMGAQCNASKSAKGDLSKGANVELTTIQAELAKAQERIAKLEKQPVQHVVLRAIERAAPKEVIANTLEDEALPKLERGDYIMNKDGSIDWQSSYIQKRQRLQDAKRAS